MTLSTHVYILDKIDHREVFRFCQEMLGRYDEEKRGPDQQDWTLEQTATWRSGKPLIEPGNPWSIANKIGQGLPAILDIGYRPGAPLRTPEQAAEHDEDCEIGCDGAGHYRRACWLDVDFDTAYGYKVDDMGCGDLHAALVAELGQWLDAKGIRWEWRNEFTGDVHGGPDRYERLIELVSGDFEATAWFQNTVWPAIERGLL